MFFTLMIFALIEQASHKISSVYIESCDSQAIFSLKIGVIEKKSTHKNMNKNHIVIMFLPSDRLLINFVGIHLWLESHSGRILQLLCYELL